MKQKREARECALQILYPLEMASGMSVNDAIDRFFEHFEADPRAQERACQIVRGVVDKKPEIDAVIQKASAKWAIDRMAIVDRCVLRLCTHELMFDAETPARVVIDEGIEIAKRFGADESARFVNGVLDQVARSVGRIADKAGGAA